MRRPSAWDKRQVQFPRFFIICTVMNKTYNLSDVGGLRRTENIYRYESKEFIGGYDGCGFEF